MMRKVIAGVVSAVVLALSGCVDPTAEEQEALAQWAATDPVFEGLTFSSVIAGGIPSSTIAVSGSVNVDDAPEFVAALVTLHEKGEELNQEMTSHVHADLDGTAFKWQGPFPTAEFGAKSGEQLAPFAAPEVAEVSISASSSDRGLDVMVWRETSISDSAAREFRDHVFGHLDMHERDTFTLRGFPLHKPARLDGIADWDDLAPNLQLRPQGARLSALVEQAERVDAATSLYLYNAGNIGPLSVWYFYADGEYDPAELDPVKEILSQSVDGKAANLIVEGPDGEIEQTTVGD
ncbi:hypothetical protein [uncultured Corynebacterium sp.]|uniref:hypothetical protein n=1 Tax=uncultured Corynebacterium sp. TaxID=159447 RepID=UPI00260941EE|nr:hypothetical protein [uncultured Corynebacterium sp.]